MGNSKPVAPASALLPARHASAVQTPPVYRPGVAGPAPVQARKANTPPVFRPPQSPPLLPSPPDRPASARPLALPSSPAPLLRQPAQVAHFHATPLQRKAPSELLAGEHLRTGILQLSRNRNRPKGGFRKAKWVREADAERAKHQAIKNFMEQRVAPWATQARIAELIDENMKDLKADPLLSEDDCYFRPSDLRIDSPSYQPQIGPGTTRFLGPNRSLVPNAEATAIHRSDLEIEMVGNVPHARVYSALWAEARANGDGKITHKDIHQSAETGKITIHTGRDQSEEGADEDASNPIMWLSGGQPLRQLKWFYKYKIEKHNPGAKPVVRSFLVPLSTWNAMSSNAVNERVAAKPGNERRPFNVDTAYGANQFGVRGDMLELLRNAAVPGSLKSYVGKRKHSLPEHGGAIHSIKDLHQQLGAPTTVAPHPIWVDKSLGKFVRTKKQHGLADTLLYYYGIWTGNENYIPQSKSKIPKARRHEQFKEFLAEQNLAIPADLVLP
jgi:hypothetical protein